jgi:hypothetical protein
MRIMLRVSKWRHEAAIACQREFPCSVCAIFAGVWLRYFCRHEWMRRNQRPEALALAAAERR